MQFLVWFLLCSVFFFLTQSLNFGKFDFFSFSWKLSTKYFLNSYLMNRWFFENRSHDVTFFLIVSFKIDFIQYNEIFLEKKNYFAPELWVSWKFLKSIRKLQNLLGDFLFTLLVTYLLTKLQKVEFFGSWLIAWENPYEL